ncbi:MAG: 50S ribosome-binding GTPase [Candidatus Saccharimonas sp.]|nr:50S ribosome-binding GTPase [Planctomycetaceae bacterium]
MTIPLTAAVLTSVGRGAVATIRVVGDLSQLDGVAVPLFHAANGRSLSQQELRRIAFGRWGREDAEEIVVSRLSDETLELHCHGGDAAVRRILNDLQRAGCAVMSWQSQSAAKGESFDAECLDALSRATTWRTAEILLEQSNGLLREAFQHLALPVSPSLCLSVSPSSQVGDFIVETFSRLDALLAWSHFGLHLTRPWSVVLTGRPNVGKSSLINRLLGYERAIVFDQPGTTRDVVTGETAFDGWPVLLADTAGLRDSAEELEAAGIALSRARLATSDVKIVLIDLGEPPAGDDERLLAEWPDAIVVAHKCDRPDRWLSHRPAGALRVSSRTGEGVDELQRQLVERLVPQVPPTGTAIPISARQVELLRAARAALLAGDEAAFRASVDALLNFTEAGLSEPSPY